MAKVVGMAHEKLNMQSGSASAFAHPTVLSK